MNFFGDIIGDFFLGTFLHRSSLCANIFLKHACLHHPVLVFWINLPAKDSYVMYAEW